MPSLPRSGHGLRVAVVLPVLGEQRGLAPMVDGVRAQVGERDWRLRVVVGPAAAGAVRPAHELASADERIAVTGLTSDGPPHAALAQGLAAEGDGDAWICLEVARPLAPGLLARLLGPIESGEADVVLALRRPARWRLLGSVAGRLPAPAAGRLGVLAGTGPWAVGPRGREAVLDAGAAGPLVGMSRTGLVVRVVRPDGTAQG
jgi:hypothetical protein